MYHKQLIYILYLFVAFVGINYCDSVDFLEFLIGPKLGEKSTSGPSSSSALADARDTVQTFGYPFESHEIVSKTGYILTLHRIPWGRKEKLQKFPKLVVLLLHGFLGSSDMFLLRGPKKDLPYILADNDYDVWLCNARGNIYSRKHKKLNPDKDLEYWDFGIEELGYDDLAVTIDYVLNITNQKDLFFINYSLGSSIGLILCSLRPEYNDKIRLFLALAPVSSIKHKLSPLHETFFSFISVFGKTLESKNIVEFLPRRTYITNLIILLCGDKMPTQKICLSMGSMILGYISEQFNTTMIPEMAKHFPAGTSLKVILNVVQYYLSGNFGGYDFGSKLLNTLHYNSSTPPTYDLSRVTVPVSLHYGPGDLYVELEDINYLAAKLPNVVGIYRIPHKFFNHIDFAYSVDSKTLLYDPLLDLIKKYS